jgi:16S rRNA (cytidine1402-2'-O)-methyltransferase
MKSIEHLAYSHSDEDAPTGSTVGKGCLYVVATPIGNLEDITVRALNVLGSADLVACEDTRRSRKLLDRWGIKTRTISLHRFSETKKSGSIISLISGGACVALISDAGTPAVSDPGNRLVRAALDAGIKVTPIPGPSSITAALSASGIDASSFVYLGFAPRTDSLRKAFFNEIVKQERPVIFFETSKRILGTLKSACEIVGSRRISVFRELTKIYEEIITGTTGSVLETLSARPVIRGELVVVLEGRTAEDQIDLRTAVTELMKEGFSGKKLAEEAYNRFGIKKNAAYAEFLEMKGLLEPQNS